MLGEAKSNVFAKASFVSEEGSISLHDPEFWSQLLPSAQATATKIRGSLHELGSTDDGMTTTIFDKVAALAKPVVRPPQGSLHASLHARMEVFCSIVLVHGVVDLVTDAPPGRGRPYFPATKRRFPVLSLIRRMPERTVTGRRRRTKSWGC